MAGRKSKYSIKSSNSKIKDLEQDEELLINLYKEYANASNIEKLRVE